MFSPVYFTTFDIFYICATHYNNIKYDGRVIYNIIISSIMETSRGSMKCDAQYAFVGEWWVNKYTVWSNSLLILNQSKFNHDNGNTITMNGA